MRHTIHFSITLLLVAMFLAVSCKNRKNDQTANPAQNKGQPATVTLALATTERLEETLETTGSLLPWREATISVEVDGRIAALHADLASVVAAGSVIARIAPEEYQLKVRQAEAELRAAQADLARITALADKEMATRQQADEAARRVEVAQVALDTAKKKLADTEVRAPFGGVIAKRLVNEGEYVRTGAPLFHLVQVSTLKFVAAIPERYVGAVKNGMNIAISTAAGTTATGIIRRVGPLVDKESRSFPIEAEVANREHALSAGAFAIARIVLPARQEVVMIPETALVSFAGTDKVFVFTDGVLEERRVTVAARRGTMIAVTGPLAAGERVVTSAAETLYHGMPAVPRTE